MTQQKISRLMERMIRQAENEIEEVLAKRTEAILEHWAKLYRKYQDGDTISRTDIYKYKRFEKEMESIKEQLHGDYKIIHKELVATASAVYVANYLRSGQLYEYQAQTPMGYAIPTTETVQQAILNPIAELTLSSLMTNHRNEIIRKIRIEIAQGIQAGEGYADMAERIKKATGFSTNKAQLVARTEGHRVQVQSRLDSMAQAQKHADIGKLWASALDLRVRRAHRSLDGQKADEEGYFHYKGRKAKGPSLWGSPSMDINCRCDVWGIVNGEIPRMRRSMEGVIPYQTYQEWYKTLSKEKK